jgi:hypothetical protein
MRQLIRQIRSLNLESYPIDQINDLLSRIGEIPILITEYHAGKIIHRARLVNDDEIVNNIDGLKYKPQKLNTLYLRASTPSKSLFYGSTISEEEETNSIFNPRVTSSMEVVPFLRNTNLNGRQRLLYGKWQLNASINLATILFTRYKNAGNQWIKNLSEEFYNQLRELPIDVQKKSKRISNFLSSEFSKCVNENENYKYLISALITQRFLNNGMDGVLYPSVRSMKLGLNVALRPEVVDEHMRLLSVLDCVVYKRNDKVIINNIAFCEVPAGSQTFELTEIVNPSLRFTEDEIQNRLRQ